MVGFVYSLAGIKDGKPTQWSHMVGVLDAVPQRRRRLSAEAAAARARAGAWASTSIEWTYDPMQAMNAHLNFAKLGVVVEEYEMNVYGESTSPLHEGNPTDRFVAEWCDRRRRAWSERLRGAAPLAPRADRRAAPAATQPAGEWLEPRRRRSRARRRRVSVEIPTGFSEMLSGAPDLALEWRMATRELFTTYFARGYRAVEFFLDRAAAKGHVPARQAGLKAALLIPERDHRIDAHRAPCRDRLAAIVSITTAAATTP